MHRVVGLTRSTSRFIKPAVSVTASCSPSRASSIPPYLVTPTNPTIPHSTLVSPRTLVTPLSTLVTPLSTLVTPLSTLVTPHSTLVSPRTLVSPLSTLVTPPTLVTPLSTLVTPHSTLVTPHSTLVTPLSTLVTPHSTLVTPLSTLVSPRTLVTPHSTLVTPHSTLVTPHSTLVTPLSTLGSYLSTHTPSYPRTWSRGNARPTYVTMATLETLHFDNVALRALPLDVQEANYVRQVSGACFSRVEPTPVENPRTVAYSRPAMELLDLPETELLREDFPLYFSGNSRLPGAQTAAHCYCGHQFGNFAGQLGDGATMYIGEVVNKSGERWEIQYKGAGLTPYSRSADGRKVLRSSIREFLCSEAMHHLGIPTTRAGTCVTSDTRVMRDVQYTGNPVYEQATVILRLAQTFIRFGSFEIFKSTDAMTGRRGPSVGRDDIREQLLDYVIQTFYPEIWSQYSDDKSSCYLAFYREIVRRTARLVAEWQCVGWCHGVLNTDNMSIVGLTIDYGPFGFMDTYDPGYICNGSDDGGRYAYDQQPDVCKWNLSKLAEALSPLIPADDTAPVLETYTQLYEGFYMDKMRKKFGLLKVSKPEDSDLVTSFLAMLSRCGADMTNSFRCLSRVPVPGEEGGEGGEERVRHVTEYFISQCCTVDDLRRINAPKMDPRQLQMFMMLAQMNPDLLQQLGRGAGALTQEMERIEKTKELQSVTEEDKRNSDLAIWREWLEKYEKRLEEEMREVEEGERPERQSEEGEVESQERQSEVGDSERRERRERYIKERREVMNSNNPRFILRNYMAQTAIEAAEGGDYSEVVRLVKLLESPYSEEVDVDGQLAGPSTSTQDDSTGTTGAAEASGGGTSCSRVPSAGTSTSTRYDSKAPGWASQLVVT